MRFGEGLKAERERRGIALDEISLATRVSVRNLHALESEHFQELPGGIFNRGIVRSYARFCGLDEDKMVDGYTEALRQHGIDPQHENDDWAEFAENVKRGRASMDPRTRLRWLGVAAMFLCLLVLGASVLALLVRRNVVRLPPKVETALHLRRAQPHPVSPVPDEGTQQAP